MENCGVSAPIDWDYEIEVLVVGFGGAGGCTAIEANDHGADVIVVEKQERDGYHSNTRMSGGAYHCPGPDGKREAIREYALAMFSGENLPWKLEGELPSDIAHGLAEHWADYAPDNRRWMRSLDPDYDAVERKPASTSSESDAAFPAFPGAADADYRVLRSTYSGEINNKYRCQKDDPKEVKESGEAFYTCIQHGLDERDIDVHWGTTAREFVVDGDDAVIGLRGERDGETVYYRAASTVLTTGGFEYDKNLRLNFLEGPGVEGWAFYGTTHNTGDGIRMALEIGSGLSKVGKAASRMITAVPERRHGLKIGLKAPAVGRPHGIVVDSLGKRYAPERKITQDPTRYFFYKEGVKFDIDDLVYPRVPSWFVFDETLRSSQAVVGMRAIGYLDIEWGEDNMAAIEKGWVLSGSTVEELGREIRDYSENRSLMNPERLVETVDVYNSYCDRGVDEEFDNDPVNMGPLREPPFYAIPLYPGGPNTKGGIMTNEQREVLDMDGEPIPNLFSAGEISSAFKFVYQGGGNIAECIVFGRVAGENAVRNARGQSRQDTFEVTR